MWNHIQQENKDIMQFVKDNQQKITTVENSQELCKVLGIAQPYTNIRNYTTNDIKVYVYL